MNEILHIYETLKGNKNFNGKIELDNDKYGITVEFNEFLHIYADDDTVVFSQNKFGAHMHPSFGYDDLEKWLTDVAEGKIIFVEDKRILSPRRMIFFLQPWNLRIIEREKFERKKDKYLSKSYLRIYTGNEIIKREKGYRGLSHQ